MSLRNPDIKRGDWFETPDGIKKVQRTNLGEAYVKSDDGSCGYVYLAAIEHKLRYGQWKRVERKKRVPKGV